MAAKKNKENKPIKAIKSIAKKEKKEEVVLVEQNQEALLPAFQIAEILNMSSFEFFIIKRKNNINDNDLLTISQLKEMYKQTIEEGR